MKITKFGRFVRAQRMTQRMQLNDMAKKLGVSASFLSGVETGRKSIPNDWTEKVSDILSLTPKQYEDLCAAIDAHPGIKKIDAQTEEAAQFLAAFSRHQSDLDGSQLCMLATMIEAQAQEKSK